MVLHVLGLEREKQLRVTTVPVTKDEEEYHELEGAYTELGYYWLVRINMTFFVVDFLTRLLMDLSVEF